MISRRIKKQLFIKPPKDKKKAHPNLFQKENRFLPTKNFHVLLNFRKKPKTKNVNLNKMKRSFPNPRNVL